MMKTSMEVLEDLNKADKVSSDSVTLFMLKEVFAVEAKGHEYPNEYSDYARHDIDNMEQILIECCEDHRANILWRAGDKHDEPWVISDELDRVYAGIEKFGDEWGFGE
jgi:hypothetical protein